MSVSSDFWPSAEHGGSSFSRLAQSFRRSSTTPYTSHQSSRKPEIAEKNALRRSSLASLPLRLARSKKETTAVPLHTAHKQEQDRLGELFFTLPSEIKTNIICYLSIHDVLNLRRTNHAILSVLNWNAATISRSMLLRTKLADDPTYLELLYPLPRPFPVDLGYLLGMLNRRTIIRQTLDVLLDFVQFDIYLIKSRKRHEQFLPARRRLHGALYRPAWFYIRYLEDLRQQCTNVPSTSAATMSGSGFRLMVSQTIAHFPAAVIDYVYYLHVLFIRALNRRLRPPTYAGTLERTLRGWSATSASENDLACLLILGGMGEAVRIMSIPKYADRVAGLRELLYGLTPAAANESSTSLDVHPSASSTSLHNRNATSSAEEVGAEGVDLFHHGLSMAPLLSEVPQDVFLRRLRSDGLLEEGEELQSPFRWVNNVVTEMEPEAEPEEGEGVGMI